MKRVARVLAAWLLGLTFVVAAHGGVAIAAELRLIAGAGIAVPLREMIAEFEKATGHKVVVRYGTAPELVAMATGSERIDLCLVPSAVLDNPAARARFAPGETPDIARIGVGVAVKAGAPKPDISTPAALKQALLNARSIASIPASATGVQLAEVYQQLGIAEEMKARIKPQPLPPQVVEALATGEAELGVFILNVFIDPRLEVVGPFPPELKREIVYAAAVARDAVEPDTAAAFIAYLQSPAAVAIIRAKGMFAD
jgi:molybdate transport system substrate-binding protein